MRIICTDPNYAGRAEELQRTVGRRAGMPDAPVWYVKPDTALLRNNDDFYIPSFTSEVACGCHLALRICRTGRSVAERFAHRYYDAVGLGIDFAARDLLRRAVAEGLPWDTALGFDRSAAVSPRFEPLTACDPSRAAFRLEVNGELCQQGDASQLLFAADRIVACVSQYMTLHMGDLIFTGTPAGCPEVGPGDRIRASLGEETLLDFEVR